MNDTEFGNAERLDLMTCYTSELPTTQLSSESETRQSPWFEISPTETHAICHVSPRRT